MDRRQLLRNSLALGGLLGLPANAQTAPVPLMDRPFNLAPIRAEAERAVRVMEGLFSRFPANPV